MTYKNVSGVETLAIYNQITKVPSAAADDISVTTNPKEKPSAVGMTYKNASWHR